MSYNFFQPIHRWDIFVKKEEIKPVFAVKKVAKDWLRSDWCSKCLILVLQYLHNILQYLGYLILSGFAIFTSAPHPEWLRFMGLKIPFIFIARGYFFMKYRTFPCFGGLENENIIHQIPPTSPVPSHPESTNQVPHPL